MPMATKLGRVVTCHEGLTSMKSMTLRSRSPARLRDKLKTYFHCRSVYYHQTWRELSYLDGLLPIKSPDPFITKSCEIT